MYLKIIRVTMDFQGYQQLAEVRPQLELAD
jgi:hypothetical protein